MFLSITSKLTVIRACFLYKCRKSIEFPVFRTYTSFPCSKQHIARKWLLVSEFKGAPKESDFKKCVEELPPIKSGEFLCQACVLSVDPYMRAYAHNFLINDVMPGAQVAQIIESQIYKYRRGDYVLGQFGWRDLTIVNPFKTPCPVIDFEELPCSLALGALGFTGNTAYFGVCNILKPKRRQIIVVSAAAGAVGMHVCQLCKLKGARVIGLCGSDEKCEFLQKTMCVHGAINYKKEDLKAKLEELTGGCIDAYWDNVGGIVSSQVMNQMKDYGKIVVCGAISTYNNNFNWPQDAPTIQGYTYYKQLSIQGFLVNSFLDDWEIGIFHNTELIRQGKLKYKEWILEGFDKVPKAFIDMMSGCNIGKALVKLDPPITPEECPDRTPTGSPCKHPEPAPKCTCSDP